MDDSKIICYTTNDDKTEMLLVEGGDDYCLEFIGYIEEILGVHRSANQKNLFKAIITNGYKKMCLLIWGESLIEKYLSEITWNRILHLDGAHRCVVQLRQKMSSGRPKKSPSGNELTH